MGVRIVVESQNAGDSSIGFYPPVSGGLLHWNFPGVNEKITARNLAPNGATGVISGSPTYNPRSVSFPNTAGDMLNTGILETDNMTLICIQDVDSGAGGLLNNIGSRRASDPSKFTYGLGLSMSATSTSSHKFLNATVGHQSTDGASNSFADIGLRVDNAEGSVFFRALTMDESTATATHYVPGGYEGTTRVFTRPAGRIRGKGSQPFIIGRVWAYLGNSPQTLYFSAIYNRVLSASEIDIIYQFTKGYFADQGIRVR
ncbi:TPA: hypothetical protein ACIAIE_003314 [Serratia fonticola]